MIQTRLLRQLDLAPGDSGRLATHLSAASGLVALGECLYVVADDENALGVFPASGAGDGVLRRLFAGELPPLPAQRKAHKPDLEILLQVPAFAGQAHGALLALGSGSTSRRERGAWFGLDSTGALTGEAQVLDLAPLHTQLRTLLPALNLEGAVVAPQELLLLQRASRIDPCNALIRIPLEALLQALSNGTFPALVDSPRIESVELGERDGVPWGFTDATILDDGRIVFSAVAEDTRDTYNDGACLGSAIGCLSRAGRLEWLQRLDVQAKVEGIDVRRAGNDLQLRMVTDADDANVPGQLLEAQIELAAAMPSTTANAM